MEPKVSIVVPIYNVEKYLAQCVESLLCQTLTDIEIILVDDGSPDKCGEIADCYAQKDHRIKVIHQENAGLGPARNTGIHAASGEYIGFVDSDDWVRPEMYQRLYDAAVQNGADIVVSGHCDISNGEVLISKPHPMAGITLRTHDEIMEIRKNLYGHGLQDTRVEAFPMAVCMSLYRNKLIQNSGVFFSNVMSEDTMFNLDIYQYADVISFVGDTNYCYRKENQVSITQTFSENKQKKYLEFLLLLKQKAALEQDQECVMRAKRMAIDYHRLYVLLVDNSMESFKRKKQYVKRFCEDLQILDCWKGYPLGALPLQQRLFHRALAKKHYGAALMMNRLRQLIKNRGRVCNGKTS